jgi:hypothetical protein
MMNRVASVCLLSIAALVTGAQPALAQGPPAVVGNAPVFAEIAALNARVAALESRVTSIETLDEADIPGTYQWVSLGIQMNSGFPARVTTGTDDLILTLRAGGTGDITGTGGRCRLTVATPGAAHCDPDPEVPPQPAPFTWTFAAGKITVVFPDNDTLVFTASVTGVFAHSISTEFLPGNTYSQIGVIVKTANP